MKTKNVVITVVAVVLVLVGAYFAGRTLSKPAVDSSQETSTKAAAQQSSASSSSAASTSSSSTSADADQLDYNTITPMQTAAAIMYYAKDKLSDQNDWHSIYTANGIDLFQSNNTEHLSDPGRGVCWSLHPSDMAGGDTPTYTVGADGTVSYYHVTTVNQNKDKDPLLTANLHDIINYVNSHHAVSEIKAKAQDIHATIDNN